MGVQTDLCGWTDTSGHGDVLGWAAIEDHVGVCGPGAAEVCVPVHGPSYYKGTVQMSLVWAASLRLCECLSSMLSGPFPSPGQHGQASCGSLCAGELALMR